MASELRKRNTASTSTPSASSDDPMVADAGPPRKWYESLSVRVILVLVALLLVVHLVLWKWIYDIWLDQDHNRLRQSTNDAWTSLNALWEHL